MPRKKIGFLGCGNMGKGILEGILKRKIASRSDILIYDVVPEKLKEVKRQLKIKTVATPAELVKRSDTVILAFKPQDLSVASAQFRGEIRKKHVIITILAGVPVARIRKELGANVSVVRAMPNLGATVGEGVSAITSPSRSALSWARKIFSGCGGVVELEEKFFDLVTALSGSGPAYFFYLMELLIQEGVRHGLSEKQAELLVKQTAKGAAILAQQSKDPVAVLRQRVTSKGGTTEAALNTFMQNNLSNIVQQAVQNAVRRAEELGRG